ncbi:hypothetical protein C8R45DRAFT_919434 [Mycena sanguinolenta]|nr:hypothetical protein C8R45DRAFT_919434 [Mycena sanguinolenta]
MSLQTTGPFMPQIHLVATGTPGILKTTFGVRLVSPRKRLSLPRANLFQVSSGRRNTARKPTFATSPFIVDLVKEWKDEVPVDKSDAIDHVRPQDVRQKTNSVGQHRRGLPLRIANWVPAPVRVGAFLQNNLCANSGALDVRAQEGRGAVLEPVDRLDIGACVVEPRPRLHGIIWSAGRDDERLDAEARVTGRIPRDERPSTLASAQANARKHDGRNKIRVEL